MSAFTVYCHGTGFNRVKGSENDELVAWFHNHTDGVEARLSNGAVTVGNYLINEGPGHGGGAVALPQQINPMTGAPRQNLSLEKVFTGPSFADHARGNTGGPKRFADTRGKLSGQGWDENTQRTVNLIQDLKFDKGQDFDTVNLVGWSRGAVTCTRIANLLFDVFDTTLSCNIFAVDPVAGRDAGEKMVDTKTLPPNVRDYVGILAMHEMRSTFKPQDWSRVNLTGGHTKCIFLPMPGVHNAQVMVKTPPEAAYITRHLGYALLTKWGTKINTIPYGKLRAADVVCEEYARLVLSLSEHRHYQTSGFGSRIAGGLSLRRRDFAKHSKMDTYTRGGKESYWINEHHRACFASAYPDVYTLIFESPGSGEIKLTANSRFARFFDAVSASGPLQQSLMAKGLLKVDEGSLWIGVGTGRYSSQLKCSWPDEFPLHA